jgi:oligoxyloglucan reducing-end-specific cellobiohydrolase
MGPGSSTPTQGSVVVTPKCLLPGAILLCPAFLWLGWFDSRISAQSGASSFAPYKWEPVRIVAGGYIPGLIAHPTQPGLIYARTDMGGVYRWNPATEQWIPLLDFNAPSDYNLQGPEIVAVDPTDANRLYIAAGMYIGNQTAMLVSADQGATFSTYPVSFAMGSNTDGRSVGERLAVNPFNPSELFMGTRQQGLWKSENYAQTWARVSSFPIQNSSDSFGVHWVLFDPANSGTIYAGVNTTSSIYKSTDDGATWKALPGQPLSWPYSVSGGTHAPAPMRAVLNPDRNLYVTYGDYPGPNGMNYGLVEKFNPSAGTWTNVTPPLDTKDGNRRSTADSAASARTRTAKARWPLPRWTAGARWTRFTSHMMAAARGSISALSPPLAASTVRREATSTSVLRCSCRSHPG